jgi:hypothetical protein
MLVVATATGATIIACGGSSSPKKPDGKITVVDSPNGSGSGSCMAAASYSPNFGSNQRATNFPASGSGSMAVPHIEEWDGPLAQGTVLDISLFAGFGGFGSGDIRNGTYSITGQDAAYSTCGVCVAIFANITSSGSGSNQTINVGAYYAADSGSVTLTSTTGTLAGSLSNIHLIHVAKSSQGDFPGDPPAVDSCTSMISSANFSATLAAGSANANVYEGTTTDGQAIRIHFLDHK